MSSTLNFLLNNVLSLTVLISFAAPMMAIERIYTREKWAPVRGWWSRVLLMNAFQLIIIWAAGFLWEGWMKQHSLFHFQGPWANWIETHCGSYADLVNTMLGGLVGYLCSTYLYYWWHRARHDVKWLWQTVHQLHHSPSTINVETSFYKHPLEIALNGVIVSGLFYLLLGLNVRAATWGIIYSGLGEFFYHWNVPTPFWLGYIIQRPEAHCVHHQKNYHQMNYSDIPLWDMTAGLLGPLLFLVPKQYRNSKFCSYFHSTFFNPPKDYAFECGFGPKENDVMGLLIFKNVGNCR
jgi:sterol desaturase/sphingolipid hydroxylase (fatty acid hydroxylase superfamily)